MRGQIFNALFGSLLLVGAVEILQRERDVPGQPLQKFDELRRESVKLRGHEENDADSLTAAQQGQRRARSRACDGDDTVKGTALPVSEIIVADAGLAGPKGGSRQSSSFGMCFRNCHLNGPGKLGARPRHRDNAEEVTSCLGQGDGCRSKLAAKDGRVGHQLEELVASLGTQYRLVRCTQGRDHAVDAVLFFLALQFIRSKRDVLRHSLHQSNSPIIERAQLSEKNEKYRVNGSVPEDGDCGSSTDVGVHSHLSPNSYPLVVLRVVCETRMPGMKRKGHEVLRVGGGCVR
ncbi:hypothetical protein ES703_125189 [subsurface metagenome]